MGMGRMWGREPGGALQSADGACVASESARATAPAAPVSYVLTHVRPACARVLRVRREERTA